MAHSLGFAPICSLKPSNRPGAITGNSVVRKAFPIKEACQNSKARNFQSLEVKVQYHVLNAKVPELILLITSMDNLKPVDYAGYAGVKGIFCVDLVMGLAFLVDS